MDMASPDRQSSHIPRRSSKIPAMYMMPARVINIVMLFIMPIICTIGAKSSLPRVIPPKNSERNVADCSTEYPRYSLP